MFVTKQAKATSKVNIMNHGGLFTDLNIHRQKENLLITIPQKTLNNGAIPENIANILKKEELTIEDCLKLNHSNITIIGGDRI